jgi:TetR/AcrR family transcriptional repressor of lmrAB and yxaGH operons
MTHGPQVPQRPARRSERGDARAVDTRARLLQAALLLFRQRGYHGVGVADVLALASAPKGCLYHHFPGGKEQMAVEVIGHVTDQIVEMLELSPQAETTVAIRELGRKLQKWMTRTAREQNASACALIASFAAEGDTAAAVAAAARAAYTRIAERIAARLVRDGAAAQAAHRTALLVIATFEGAGLVSQTLGDPSVFAAATERAAELCQTARARSHP